MKLPVTFARPFLTLICAAATLLLPPRLRSAPASSAPNPPGTQEVYGGTVAEHTEGTVGAPAVSRWGSIQLVVVDGAVTGRFTFPAPENTPTTATTDCRGYLDPVTNRGFLRLSPPGGGPTEKIALLLRQGVLTGGTMEADGQVLAFRLELFLVVAP